MPASVYSVQFVAAHSVATNQVVTVPAGAVYIVRDIDIYNESGIPNALGFLGSAGQALWVPHDTASAGGNFFQWRGRQVFTAGQTFTLEPLPGPWDVTVSGYSLTLP